MLDLRSPLIWGAAPAGLVVGALAWVLFAGAGPVAAKASEFEARLGAVKGSAGTGRPAGPDFTGQATAHPVFAVGGAAASDAVVTVSGIALTPRRAAALVSINGKPAEWMERGATREGVTLQDVQPGKVVVDTAVGPKDVVLGAAPEEKPATSAPAR